MCAVQLPPAGFRSLSFNALFALSSNVFPSGYEDGKGPCARFSLKHRDALARKRRQFFVAPVPPGVSCEKADGTMTAIRTDDANARTRRKKKVRAQQCRRT